MQITAFGLRTIAGTFASRTIRRFMGVATPTVHGTQHSTTAHLGSTDMAGDMRLLTVKDVGVIANQMRKNDGLSEMPYFQILKSWNNLRRSNSAYEASDMVGRNYVFTPTLAFEVAKAISTVEYRQYKPRRPKSTLAIIVSEVCCVVSPPPHPTEGF